MAIRNSTQALSPFHIRRIKTGSIMYDYQRKTRQPPQAEVPWLQLKGHWLAQAGFRVNAPVTVRVMAGCLVLTTEGKFNGIFKANNKKPSGAGLF